MSQQNESEGGLPISGADDQVGVVQDQSGDLYRTTDTPLQRIGHTAQYQNQLLLALAQPMVQASLAKAGNLRMRDVARLNMVSKEIGLDPDRGLQREVAFGHFARLRDYPYLYRYDPVYDPAHGFPPQAGIAFPGPPAGFPARDFHYVQPLSFGDQTNSNPTFPRPAVMTPRRAALRANDVGASHRAADGADPSIPGARTHAHGTSMGAAAAVSCIWSAFALKALGDSPIGHHRDSRR